MKMSSKRRKTKDQIEEEKRSKLEMEREIAAKMQKFDQLQRDVAQM